MVSMKIAAAILVGLLVSAGAAGSAMAQTVRPDDQGVIEASLTMTEGSGNVVVLQQPRTAEQRDGFISLDTVIIGCTAGAAAGALAIALPVLTVASSGIGLPASASAILSTAGIGCAVGVVSGLAAIGTAWSINLISGGGATTAD